MKAILAPLCVLLCAGLASAQVTVTGTGKVSYVPDLAHVSVGVVSDGKTATEAWDSNRAIVKKLFDALKKHGIAAKDMTSASATPPAICHEIADKAVQAQAFVSPFKMKAERKKVAMIARELNLSRQTVYEVLRRA